MTDKPEIVYRFTPQFDGAHLRGVPPRDLTQEDVDALEPRLQRDAFAPHPLYGTPLYTAVDGPEKKAQDRAVADVKAAKKDGSE